MTDDGNAGASSQKKPLNNSPKTVQGRNASQLRKHLKKRGKFIKHFQAMADAEDISACDFVPNETQVAGAPARPGRIGKTSMSHILLRSYRIRRRRYLS